MKIFSMSWQTWSCCKHAYNYVFASGFWRCFQIKLYSLISGCTCIAHYGLNVLTSCMHFNKWLIDKYAMLQVDKCSRKHDCVMGDLHRASFTVWKVASRNARFAKHIWQIYATVCKLQTGSVCHLKAFSILYCPSGKTSTQYTVCL